MKTHKLTAATLLLALSTAAPGTTAGEGFYLGANLGSAGLDENFDGFKIDDDATATRLNAGWQINGYFALEIGYQNFGDFEQDFTVNGVSSSVRLSADGYTLGVAGSYRVGERFELFGRAGAFFWDGEAEINNVSQADPGDTNPYFGAGLGYRITNAFSVSADWTRYDLESTTSDVFSVGVQIRFGK